MSKMVDRIVAELAECNAEALGTEDTARRVIAAMRDPTPDMHDAVLKSMSWIKDEKQRQSHVETQKEQWRTMIEAALK